MLCTRLLWFFEDSRPLPLRLCLLGGLLYSCSLNPDSRVLYKPKPQHVMVIALRKPVQDRGLQGQGPCTHPHPDAVE